MEKFEKLELSRAQCHTLRAVHLSAQQCTEMRAVGTCWRPLPTYSARLGCVHEQKAQGGAVDRHGQQKCSFATLIHPWPLPTILSVMEQFFQRNRAYELLKCLDLEIWWFLGSWQTDRQTDRWTKPIALPLAVHARGIKFNDQIRHNICHK